MQRSTSKAIFHTGGLPVAGLLVTGEPTVAESSLRLLVMAHPAVQGVVAEGVGTDGDAAYGAAIP